jgi:titin
VSTSSTSAVINGLINGSPYTFKVNSVNTNGNSVNYVSISATPFTTPGVPVNILLSSTDTTGTISWQAPISDGGSSILGYKIYDSSGSIYDTSGNVVTDTGSIYTTNANTYTITGLTINQTYTFNLKASNAAGNSLGSVLTIKTGVPGTPINLTAIPGDTSVVLTWTAPTTGTPTGYRIEYSGTSETTASNILTKTLTGLVNTRQYTFSVFATTSNGDSLVPAIVNATPGLPYAPTALNGYVRTGSVTLSWTAPSVTGGSAITGYQVGYTIGSGTSITDVPNITTTNATISGLTSGTSHTFTIKTKNANGNSLSSASITLIPA